MSKTKVSNQFPTSCCRLITVPLVVIILSIQVIDSTILAAQSTTGMSEMININILPHSSPTLFNCQTPVNSTFLDIAVNQTAQSALTDGNPDTGILGNAVFDVSFINASSLVNNPGPDLKVIELRGPERFKATVFDSNKGYNESISVRPTVTNEMSSCGRFINEAQLDLSTFGVANGSSVSSIRFDNLGIKDSLNGSDIAEVSVIEQVAKSNTSSIASLP